MNPANDDRTIDLPPADAAGAALRRYESAWRQALATGLRPDQDGFVAGVPASEQERLKDALTRLDRQFEQQLLGATLDPAEAAKLTRPESPVDTMLESACTSPTDSDFTLDTSGNPGPNAAAAADRTIELPAADPMTAATIDPEQAPKAGGRTLSGRTLGGRSLPAEENAPGMPHVPGFIILGELGRGGMGVVYKARQARLNRLVALKMVLAGAHASPEQLARFNTEGEAVAQIQHPNIVQIYEVGEHEGLPFFSLEFVDGGSLQQKYDGKPQPPREAAEMMHQLALAVACAHDHGIVHRDLKPANVLLTKGGLPKITDFGLAKRLESDCSQTRSGTLMGTPSYMAPEQAKGLTQEIGPLADVYALGVMLYEALTGRVPFIGASIIDTLQQVQTLEPVPPSRLEPKVPIDLETICLKCLQKEPKKRYASAQELADDLDYFLRGMPIKARPVGNAERLVRWCKRNPRVAALSGTVLALLVLAAVGSTAAAVRMSKLHDDALAARERADQKAKDEEAARALADRNAEAARKAQAEEAEARALADKNAEVANHQANLSLSTLQAFIGKMQERLDQSAGTLPLKRDLLIMAMDGLNRMSKDAKTAQKPNVALAAAHMKMAEMLRQVGEGEEAIRQYEACHAIITRRAEEVRAQKDPPNLDAALNNLASTFTGLGDMKQNLRRDMPAALGYFREALRIRDDLVKNPPPRQFLPPGTVKKHLAGTHLRVGGVLLALGDPAGALGHDRRALAICEELAAANPKAVDAQLDLAMAHVMVGQAAFRLSDRSADRHCARALEILRGLLAAHKDNPRFKEGLAWAHRVSGVIALRDDRLPDARKHLDASLAACRELAAADAVNVDFQVELATALARSAALALRLNDAATADKQFRECLDIRRRVLARDPGNDRRQMELLTALPRCGEVAEAARLAEKLLAGKHDAELLLEVSRCYAQCAAAVKDSAQRADYEAKAANALEEAVKLGFKDAVALTTEPDLDPLRENAAFKDVLAKVKGL